MAINRRTLTALASALAASLGALGAASAAQASAYFNWGFPHGFAFNDRTPTFDYGYADPGHTIVLTDQNGTPYSAPVTVDASGQGDITADVPLPTGTNIFLLREYNGATLYDEIETYITVDQAPVLSGTGDGETVDPGQVAFGANGALPNRPVVVTIAQQGGSARTTLSRTANGAGVVSQFGSVPALAPGEYAATAQTVDDEGIYSDPGAPRTFYVAPAQPAITALGGQAAINSENLNQNTPTLTVSGVLAGAEVKLYTLDPGTAQPVLVGEQTAAGAGEVTVQVGAGGSGVLHHGLNQVYATQTIDENGTPVSSDGFTDFTSPVTLNVNVNTAAPTLSGAVDDGATTGETQPWFRASDALDNGPDNQSGVEFILRHSGAMVVDSGWVPTNDGGSATWQPPAELRDGTYTLSAVTVDDLGHVNSGAPSNSITFTVDTTPPGSDTNPTPPGSDTNPTPPGSDTNPTPPGSDTNPTPPGSGTNPTPPGSGTKPTPPGETNPTPPTLTAPPKLNTHSLSTGHPIKVSFSLTRPGSVTLTLTARVHGKLKVIGTVVVRAAKAGRASYTLSTKFAGHRLGKGAYTLALRAAGQSGTFSTALTVR